MTHPTTHKYPLNLLTWQPVFDWLTRLDAKAEAHGWDLWVTTTKELAEGTDSSWYYLAANYIGAVSMVPGSDPEARMQNDLLLKLEELGWIRAVEWQPKRSGAPRPRKGYLLTLFASPVDCTWEPGNKYEELQEFVRSIARR